MNRTLGTEPCVVWATLLDQPHSQLRGTVPGGSGPGEFQVTFPFCLSKSKCEKLGLMPREDHSQKPCSGYTAFVCVPVTPEVVQSTFYEGQPMCTSIRMAVL